MQKQEPVVGSRNPSIPSGAKSLYANIGVVETPKALHMDAKVRAGLVEEILAPAMKSHLAKIHKLLGEGEKSHAWACYEIGLLALEIKRTDGAKKYGKNAMALLAADVERDETTIGQYATLPEHLDKKQYAGLLRRTNSKGRPLTMSHILVLVGVPDKAKREELIAKWAKAEKPLSVIELEKLLNQKSDKSAGEPRDSVTGSGAPRGSSRLDPFEATSNLAKSISEGSREFETWRRDVLSEIKDVLNEKSMALLKKLKQACEVSMVEFQATIIDIDAAMAEAANQASTLGSSPASQPDTLAAATPESAS